MTFVCVCVCLCGLRGPLDPSGFSQLLPSQTTCPLVCCSLPCFVSHSQPKIFALDVPFVWPKLAPNLPKEEFLLIFGFSSSAICTVGPCLKTPVLSVRAFLRAGEAGGSVLCITPCWACITHSRRGMVQDCHLSDYAWMCCLLSQG